MSIRPILYNTDMVRAILEDRKTVTRRVVKPQPVHESGFWKLGGAAWSDNLHEITPFPCHTLYNRAPYHPGDILYVRETFQLDYLSNVLGTGRIHYKADDTYSDFTFAAESYKMMRRAQLKPGWRPNGSMPREAARIFLRVTDVRVERLQEITELDILEKEGVTVDFPQQKPSYMSLAYTETRLKPAVKKAYADLWNSLYSKPIPVKVNGVIDHYESYPWEDIQETRTYKGKPWYVIGNPWVWVIEFERISREEAEHNA